MSEQSSGKNAQGRREEKAGHPGRMLSKEQIDRLLANVGSKEGTGGVAPLSLSDLGKGEKTEGAGSIDMIRDVSMNVRIELGRSKMAVQDILKLKQGSVVTLDKLAGDFVDVLVNDRLVARGEVLILNDSFCVRIAEIVTPEE